MRIRFFILIILFTEVLFAQDGHKKFTIEEIFSSNKFSSKTLRGVRWIEGGNKFTYLEMDTLTKQNNIWVYDLKSKQRKLFLNAEELKINDSSKPFMIMNYEFSPNEKKILFTGLIPARRQVSGGAIYIYDLNKKKFFEIETQGNTKNVKFSNDGNKIGYVKNDNIFVYDLINGKETQLTFDGDGIVLNGHFDWVYEEEFSISDGWQFSPDGKQIAFWRLDQTPVPQIEIQQFDSLYFNSIKMRYPKAGAPNSIVKIGVVDIHSGKTTWMDIGDEIDIYIPRIRWTETPNILSIQRLNRLQNKLELMLADSKTGKSKVIYTDVDSCWIDVEDANLVFLKDKKRFIISSERDGFKHLYLYDMNGNLINQITKGNWEVAGISSVDEKNEQLFFTAGIQNPTQRFLYKINFDGSGFKQITKDNGTSSFNFSPNSKYCIR
ncbi:MAG: DPP IV N-terminal domain-containing protein, partial [Ignavibacteria bacterium]|nr:DPP IV N-terminal domain-containing protein [Ignavibacteria bacterium]